MNVRILKKASLSGSRLFASLLPDEQGLNSYPPNSAALQSSVKHVEITSPINKTKLPYVTMELQLLYYFNVSRFQ